MFALIEICLPLPPPRSLTSLDDKKLRFPLSLYVDFALLGCVTRLVVVLFGARTQSEKGLQRKREREKTRKRFHVIASAANSQKDQQKSFCCSQKKKQERSSADPSNEPPANISSIIRRRQRNERQEFLSIDSYIWRSALLYSAQQQQPQKKKGDKLAIDRLIKVHCDSFHLISLLTALKREAIPISLGKPEIFKIPGTRRGKKRTYRADDRCTLYDAETKTLK